MAYKYEKRTFNTETGAWSVIKARVVHDDKGKHDANDENHTIPLGWEWTEENTTTVLADVDAEGFSKLTKKQLKIAIFVEWGVTAEDVLGIIDKIPSATEKQLALITFEDSLSYSRSHPLVASVSAVLNKDKAEVDRVWLKYQGME